MTPSWEELKALVKARAAARCEYCRMHQSLQGGTFHVEHIIPESKGGPTALDNLALACPGCNLHKASRLEIDDPDDGTRVRWFNPRIDVWSTHFRWQLFRIVGLTAVGRATMAALQLNSDRRMLIREAEEIFGLFPPPVDS